MKTNVIVLACTKLPNREGMYSLTLKEEMFDEHGFECGDETIGIIKSSKPYEAGEMIDIPNRKIVFTDELVFEDDDIVRCKSVSC
jgi:hypothetical protein